MIDSGFGPEPVIDGTADPDPEIVSGLIVPPSGIRMLVSWTSECHPNHKAPIDRILIGPTGDERVVVPGLGLPRSLGRQYCWNDGVGLGIKSEN